MSTIVTRAGKGSPLTNLEVDTNFTTLNTDKLEKSANLADVANASTARTNLGLGSVDNTSDATKNVASATLSNKTISAANNTITTAASGNLAATSLNAALAELQTDIDTRATIASPSTTGTLNHSGDIVLSGSGKRITGDLSNATLANRMMFQTSTVNANSVVSVIPNGTAQQGNFTAYNNSDPANSSTLQLLAGGAGVVSIQSSITGAGSYLPITFLTGGAERMRIDASGNVGIGTVDPKAKFAAYSSAITGGSPVAFGNAADPNVMGRFGAASICMDFGVYASGNQWIQARSIGNYTLNYDLTFQPNGGNTLHVGSGGGLGYGTGAGGTVTQATSKATAVTLNKPCGRITMNNAALSAGATATFFMNNSIASVNDICSATVNPVWFASYNISMSCDTGYVYFVVKNITAGSLSDALIINFAIIKGATA